MSSGFWAMRRFVLFAMLFPACAYAQEQAIQRSLIQRDQQSEAFMLQLRQWQERVAVPQGDLRRQQEVDARQVIERHRLEEVSDRQLRDVAPDTAPALRPYERQRAEDERRALGKEQR
jgi:hypothetical protein